MRPITGIGSDIAKRPVVEFVIPPVIYYVSSAGNNGNDGRTPATPWQTLSKVNGSTFSPGDTISFNGGDTFSGTLTVPSGGSSGHPVTFNSYGTGQATIAAAANTDGIALTNKSYVTIDSLTLTGAGTTAGVGIHVVASGGFAMASPTVSNCNVSGFPDNGVEITSGTGSIASPSVLNTTVSGCTFGAIARTAGIFIGGAFTQGSSYSTSNLLIRGCTVKNNTGAAGQSNWCGSGIYVGQTNVALVENCIADNNGANSNNSSGPTGIWTSGSQFVVIQRCESKNTKSNNGDGGGFDIDGGTNDCTVQYCYSHNNKGFGFMSFQFDGSGFTGNNNNVIRYNVSSSDGLGGIKMVSSGVANTNGQVYGNTILTTGTVDAIYFTKGSAALTQIVSNNIIKVVSGAANYINTTGNPSNVTITGNDYFGAASFSIIWNAVTYTTMLLWQTATGKEKISGVSVALQADPVFAGSGPALLLTTPVTYMDGLRLDNSSTLLGAGVNLFTNYGINPGSTDWFGGVQSSGQSSWTPGICSIKSAISQRVVTATGSFTVPADCVTIQSVDCISAGGSSNGSGAGSGAGAWAASTILASGILAGQSINCVVGTANAGAKGGDTVFNATDLANAVSLGPTIAVGAEGGGTNSGATGGTGGKAANSVGLTKNDGGDGGSTSARSGGGGGGGPDGAGGKGGEGGTVGGGGGGGSDGGGAGVNGNASTGGKGGFGPYTAGGNGNIGAGGNGSQGSGGGGATTVGAPGSAGRIWVVSSVNYGPGAGAGGSNGVQTASNIGGNYGGGAGGRNAALGAAGLIRFAYQIAANQ